MKNINAETIDLSGWPLPDAYLIEVGRLALMWSRLENLLRNTVANLAGLENLSDPRLFTVFKFSDFERDVQLLEQLCAQQAANAPNLKRYPALAAELRAARQAYALYIHGGMTPNPGDGEIEMDMPRADHPKRTETRRISVVDIRRAVLLIDETQHSLYNMVAALERPDRIVME